MQLAETKLDSLSALAYKTVIILDRIVKQMNSLNKCNEYRILFCVTPHSLSLEKENVYVANVGRKCQ